MLTDHPEALAKLRAEILETVGPKRAPTPEDFRDMKYMRAVLNGVSLECHLGSDSADIGQKHCGCIRLCVYLSFSKCVKS